MFSGCRKYDVRPLCQLPYAHTHLNGAPSLRLKLSNVVAKARGMEVAFMVDEYEVVACNGIDWAVHVNKVESSHLGAPDMHTGSCSLQC